MSVRNKDDFKNCIQEIMDDLNLSIINSSTYFSAKNLNKFHWQKIWEVHDKSKLELATISQEIHLTWDSYYKEIKKIILEAHGTDASEFLQRELKNNYMNTSNHN